MLVHQKALRFYNLLDTSLLNQPGIKIYLYLREIENKKKFF